MTFAELEERYVSLLEAARILHIHHQTLRRLIQTGKGPPWRLFAGTYLIDRNDLAMFQATYDRRPGAKGPKRLL